MHPIQWIMLVFAAIAEIAVVAGFRRGKIAAKGIFFWTVLWLLVGLVAVWPDSTYIFARWAGITRGADLVLYLGFLAVFFLLFRHTLRMEKIERDLAALVRVLALRDAPEQTNQPRADGDK
jgi:hypothetical protein